MTPPFAEAVGAWIRIALLSFGGPAGQIGIIHRVVVEEKQWVSEPRFLHALSYCMMLPGPEAQQLATYLGWVLHGTRGALVAGTLFILPGILAILGLSLAYVAWADTPLLSGIFLGLKPAVLAVVLVALFRLGRRGIRSRIHAVIAGFAFLALAAFQVPFPIVVLSAAIAGYLTRPTGASAAAVAADPSAVPPLRRVTRILAIGIVLWFLPLGLVLLGLGPGHILATEAVFFGKVAVVTFGGAYAVLNYVAQQAVDVQGWLTPPEMLDGLAMAETTPGPLIMVLQFVGFMGAFRDPGGLEPYTAAVLGSLITTWSTFLPSFMFILAGAPWVEYLAGSPKLTAALEGITAAVIGVILNLGIWFGMHVLFGSTVSVGRGPLSLLLPVPETIHWAAAGIALLSFLALTRFRVPLLAVLAGAAVAGILLPQSG